MRQSCFLDLPDHLKRLSDAGDPLDELDQVVYFEAFCLVLNIVLDYSDGQKAAGRLMANGDVQNTNFGGAE